MSEPTSLMNIYIHSYDNLDSPNSPNSPDNPDNLSRYEIIQRHPRSGIEETMSFNSLYDIINHYPTLEVLLDAKFRRHHKQNLFNELMHAHNNNNNPNNLNNPNNPNNQENHEREIIKRDDMNNLTIKNSKSEGSENDNDIMELEGSEKWTCPTCTTENLGNPIITLK